MSIQKIILVFLSLLLFSCIGGPSSTDKFLSAPLNGKIFDYDNLPCSGVLITVDNNIKVKSDINGRFVVPSLTKGEHHFLLAKSGYEDLEFTFDFINKNQVLWLKMLSLEQIIKKIEENIDNKALHEAMKLIERAQTIDPDNSVVHYLTAVISIQKKQFEEAITILTKILESGSEEPIVYLTLTDIYEHNLDDPVKAIEYLEKYLSLTFDEEAQERLEYLRGRVSED